MSWLRTGHYQHPVATGSCRGHHYSRLLGVGSKVGTIPPHERNVGDKVSLDITAVSERVDQPFVAGFVAGCQLQIVVLAKGFLGCLDAICLGHIDALGKRSHGDVGEGRYHLHTRRLVLPVEVVEIATASHDNAGMRPVFF